jgi:hypothetical protein
VKPLYKKGDRCDIQNYKPISVLSVFQKYWKGWYLIGWYIFNLIIGYLQKLNMVSGKGNVLKQQFCHL